MLKEHNTQQTALLCFSMGYLVTYQNVCSGVCMRQPGNGNSRKRVFSQLRLIPNPVLDVSETGAAFALRRVNLHNCRRCHVRRQPLFSSLRLPHNEPTRDCLVFRPPLCNVPESAKVFSLNIPGSLLVSI